MKKLLIIFAFITSLFANDIQMSTLSTGKSFFYGFNIVDKTIAITYLYNKNLSFNTEGLKNLKKLIIKNVCNEEILANKIKNQGYTAIINIITPSRTFITISVNKCE